jgi:pimeloyl-ACP methyl ester carboxylesterase
MNWPGVEFIRVAANGINFEIATMGAGDRLALCLHGFPEHAYSWRHQMPLLAKLGYRVWVPNLRGYGNTDSPQEIAAYKTRTLVEDVAALIKAAKAKETILLAHDWGGALAWSLAISSQHAKTVPGALTWSIRNLSHDWQSSTCRIRRVLRVNCAGRRSSSSPGMFFSFSFHGCRNSCWAAAMGARHPACSVALPRIPRAFLMKRWRFIGRMRRVPAA